MTKKKDPKDYLKMGRPTLYTPELADEICDAISSSDNGLAHLCVNNSHWPSREQIFVWLRRYPEFAHKYTQAKECQVEVSVDYMQELMSEPHRFVDQETGQIRIDVPMIRTKMDAIKWQAGKLKPKKYGDAAPQQIINNIAEDTFAHKHKLDEKNKKDY